MQSPDMSQNSLSINNKDSIESSIKLKQERNAKLLKEHKESIKRKKQPENWKVNMKKNARLKGEEYIGVGGRYRDNRCNWINRQKLTICFFYFMQAK